MEEFNLNNIGKTMPHKLPDGEFFDNFSQRLFAKIESENICPIPVAESSRAPRSSRRMGHLARFSIVSGVAAAVAVALVAFFDSSELGGVNNDFGFAIDNAVVESIDSFLTRLSDDELNELFVDSSSHLDFYLNLPNF